MADAADSVRLSVPGLDLEARLPWHAVALRYFDPHGPFAAAASEVTGTTLPAPLAALAVPARVPGGAGLILAWLRPTETLVLSEHAAPLAELQQRLANAAGGYVVDLSGGLKMLRVRGPHLAELLSRLGGTAVALRLNEARRGRLADVSVLAISLRAGEALLVVDRAYAEHLGGWIRATLADWTNG